MTKSCCRGRGKKWQLTYTASWLNVGLFVYRKRCNISTHQITDKCDVLVTELKRGSSKLQKISGSSAQGDVSGGVRHLCMQVTCHKREVAAVRSNNLHVPK